MAMAQKQAHQQGLQSPTEFQSTSSIICLLKRRVCYLGEMSNQYTIDFPTLERLWSFQLAIQPETYVIDVSQKSIKCSCSNLELMNALTNYGGTISKNPIGRQTTSCQSDTLI